MEDRTRVPITDDLVLDFGGIFTENPEPAPTEPTQAAQEPKTQCREPLNPKKAVGGHTGPPQGQQAKGLYMQSIAQEEQQAQLLAIYQEYQEAKKVSAELQAQILHGLKGGGDIYDLFLKAAQAISLMTHNKQFYTQAEADTLAIYGEGLLQRAPLRKQLERTQERLSHLEESLAAETDPAEKAWTEQAIRAHKGRIQSLESMIQKAE